MFQMIKVSSRYELNDDCLELSADAERNFLSIFLKIFRKSREK